LSVKRPKDDELKKRDSTVKKCTSITGLLKQVKDDWLDGRFLLELERVNLNKYSVLLPSLTASSATSASICCFVTNDIGT
jgi:hypothetical protein